MSFYEPKIFININKNLKIKVHIKNNLFSDRKAYNAR